MRILTYIFFLLIALLGMTFAYLNANNVSINYYLNTKSIPLSLLLAISLALGMTIGLFITLLTYVRLKGENIRLQRKLKLIDKELTELRNLPANELP